MRLIDADAMCESIRKWRTKLKPEIFVVDRVKSDVLNKVIVMVENNPTIEAEPVRHGEWIRKDDTFKRYKCSESGWEYLHCGAKLEGEAIMKYRKKPVVVDAFKLGFEGYPEWFVKAVTRDEAALYDENGSTNATIRTLEGWMHASHGDYIIRGIKGEIYPCKPDVFMETYEAFTERGGHK